MYRGAWQGKAARHAGVVTVLRGRIAGDGESTDVLGSCGAWPEPGRACSGVLVEQDGFRIVIDLGYGTAARLLGQLGSVSADDLNGVILSHRYGGILLADEGLTLDLEPGGAVS